MKDIIEYYEQRHKMIELGEGNELTESEAFWMMFELNSFMCLILNCKATELFKEIELIKTTFKNGN